MTAIEDSIENRLVEMEIRYTELQADNHDLTELVYQQSRIVDGLRRRLEEMESRMRELAPAAVGDADAEPPPPHY